MIFDTERFILEELTPEDKNLSEGFARVSERMVWKDTVEILLNEKKLDAYIKNLAIKDLEVFMSEKEKSGDVLEQINPLSGRPNKSRSNNIFLKDRRLNWFIEMNQKKVLKYRQQLIEECKKCLGIDFENDPGAMKKLRMAGIDKIKNENLTPPIPISDWHYNIQFLKPKMKEVANNPNDDPWEAPIARYIQKGIEANSAEDREFHYFKIIDKSNNKVVGISRVCTKPKDFVVGYDDKSNPITVKAIGDPGIFLDTTYQGALRGSEVYATTLSVLNEFLLSEEDKSLPVIIKFNILNRASRGLQESVGANIVNGNTPIDNRFYALLNWEDFKKSKCVEKLEAHDKKNYNVTNEGTSYRVSLSDGSIHRSNSGFSITGYINKLRNKLKSIKDGSVSLQDKEHVNIHDKRIMDGAVYAKAIQVNERIGLR